MSNLTSKSYTKLQLHLLLITHSQSLLHIYYVSVEAPLITTLNVTDRLTASQSTIPSNTSTKSIYCVGMNADQLHMYC